MERKEQDLGNLALAAVVAEKLLPQSWPVHEEILLFADTFNESTLGAHRCAFSFHQTASSSRPHLRHKNSCHVRSSPSLPRVTRSFPHTPHARDLPTDSPRPGYTPASALLLRLPPPRRAFGERSSRGRRCGPCSPASSPRSGPRAGPRRRRIQAAEDEVGEGIRRAPGHRLRERRHDMMSSTRMLRRIIHAAWRCGTCPAHCATAARSSVRGSTNKEHRLRAPSSEDFRDLTGGLQRLPHLSSQRWAHEVSQGSGASCLDLPRRRGSRIHRSSRRSWRGWGDMHQRGRLYQTGAAADTPRPYFHACRVRPQSPWRTVVRC